MGGFGLARPAMVLLYAGGCWAHVAYRRHAALRQSAYAQARVSPIPTELRPDADWPKSQTREVVWAGAIIGGIIAAVVPLALVGVHFLLFTPSWDWSVVAAVVPPAFACGVLFGAFAGLQWERDSRATLSTPATGLPVDACKGLEATLWIYPAGYDEPFATLPDGAGPLRAGDVFSGYLFGDLRTGGFGALAADGLATPIEGVLGGSKTKENPYQIKDAPGSDAVAVARDSSANYEIHTNEIVVIRERSHGEPIIIHTVPLGRVEQVRFYSVRDSEGGEENFLDIVSNAHHFRLSQHQYGPDFPWILGHRLRQHGREDVVADDRTRLHLGLVGKDRPHYTSSDVRDRQAAPAEPARPPENWPSRSAAMQYEIEADAIVLNRMRPDGEPMKQTVPIARVEEVHFYHVPGDENGGKESEVLYIGWPGDYFRIARSECGPDFPFILGQSLRQHGQEGVAVDDKTRRHLGFGPEATRPPYRTNSGVTDRKPTPQ